MRSRLATLCVLICACSSPSPSEPPTAEPEPDSSVAPAEPELCDGLDNDGDDVFDEEIAGACPFTCDSSVPCEIPIQIVAGDSHTCALTDAGTVYCWGYNRTGQLGTPELTISAQPIQVEGVKNATGLVNGGDITCAWNLQTATCWGGRSRVPFEIALLGLTQDVAVGSDFLCVFERPGNVLCRSLWLDDDFFSVDPSPPDLITALDAYDQTLCARTMSGELWCWGAGEAGRFGLFVRLAANVEAFDVGPGGSVCAVASGALVCFDAIDRAPEPAEELEGNGVAEQIGVGRRYRCARDVRGRFACWMGELDAPLRDITDLAVGGEHVCTLDEAGAVRCFGHRDHGALGDSIIDGSVAKSPVSLQPGPEVEPTHGVITRSFDGVGGACDNPFDFSVLANGTKALRDATADRVQRCSSGCGSNSECLAGCEVTHEGEGVPSPRCDLCFVLFEHCSGDGCYEQFVECAGFPVDFALGHFTYAPSTRCTESEASCFAGLPIGSACADAAQCRTGSCEPFSHGNMQKLCVAPAGTSCGEGDTQCSCPQGEVTCGATP